MTSLHIDPALLREAEQQAKRKNIDLSKAVESFFCHFISQAEDREDTVKITPFIERLGTNLDLSADFNEREAYRNHLEEKYK